MGKKRVGPWEIGQTLGEGSYGKYVFVCGVRGGVWAAGALVVVFVAFVVLEPRAQRVKHRLVCARAQSDLLSLTRLHSQ